MVKYHKIIYKIEMCDTYKVALPMVLKTRNATMASTKRYGDNGSLCLTTFDEEKKPRNSQFKTTKKCDVDMQVSIH